MFHPTFSTDGQICMAADATNYIMIQIHTIHYIKSSNRVKLFGSTNLTKKTIGEKKFLKNKKN